MANLLVPGQVPIFAISLQLLYNRSFQSCNGVMNTTHLTIVTQAIVDILFFTLHLRPACIVNVLKFQTF